MEQQCALRRVLAVDPIYNNYTLGRTSTATTGAMVPRTTRTLSRRRGSSSCGCGTAARATCSGSATGRWARTCRWLRTARSRRQRHRRWKRLAPTGLPLPAEIPFHSLSYPDIDHTVMRPAALPPTLFTTTPSPQPAVGTPAYTLYGTAAPGEDELTPWNNPSTYGETTMAAWNMFSGDPGVRNYFLYSGYPSAYLSLNPTTLPSGWVMNPPTPPRRSWVSPAPRARTPEPDAADPRQRVCTAGDHLLAGLSAADPRAAAVPDSGRV